ncbi:MULTISPECIES: D-alanyl-D-alanine carboxypeptidase PBP3 [Streptococcus]|uniref:serine-type D-Ala-D-Ala carboxypeptidase n=1 Tax=Streptococcus equinus TaxID=1335 RepID=A0A239REY2_STREI|nr:MULTISPECIES: D-alanyl-D-alanine carboxypeptidase PBP3 [Streptococcus]KEY46573.1 peptidase M15 [Streptococcus equinus]KFN87543.1 D-alanyl-D-alanine carboxypeptidase [Streptococcus equinus ATCC 33317]MDO4886287.1 D-alanyl-D-alanine carboxypeptidase PBP3 [Streptococcus sp.]SDQ47339.1 D-alanyl-D-alanine carboxypeptidase (penicillin-binding protein 5/6) [Streptococcus equinus]SDQ61368.1 D-alanyl-D-alanine carboxypeptidase (penicillin-binding protein 5/6) [Streptococcus equinus]
MKKVIAALAILLAFIGSSVYADDFDVAAKHAIAVEATTGKVLYEKDATTPAGIASMTKILTVYLTYKEIDKGNLSWDTKVPISDYAYDLTANSDASNVPMEAREYTVEQLVNAAMVASANSAAIALAEQIGGSESNFVDMMKAQLNEWGITDAKLVNASGLNNSYLGDNIYPGSSSTDENMLSARDIAIIARHLITEYPDVLKISSQTTADFDGSTMNTYNYMLKDMPYERDGVDGLKTGTTELAGASFVATSTENGMRIISVVMNADGWEENDFARFEATNKLLDYVKSNYEMTTIIEAGQSYKNSKAKVKDGKEKTVPVVAAQDLNVVHRIGTDVSAKFSSKAKGYEATINKGDKVGKFEYNDNQIVGTGYLDSKPSVPALAKKEVKKSIFLKVWWNHFVTYVNEKL